MTLAIVFALTLLLGWFPGDPTPATVEHRITAHVSDDKRREQALTAYKQIVVERRGYDEALQRRGAEIAQVVRNQRAPRQAFEQLFGSFDADRVVATRRMLDARLRLRAALTADEWQAVFAR